MKIHRRFASLATLRGAERRALSLLAIATAGALGFAYHAWAQDQGGSTSKPALSVETAPKLRVAKVDGNKVFSGFTKAKRLQEMNTQLMAAKQSGDNAKTTQLTQQFSQLRQQIHFVMMDGLNAVAKEQHIDLVLLGPNLDGAVYKAPELQVADITPAVVDKINSLAMTRPALDSQPASEPAAASQSAPVLPRLPRPRIRVQPPPSK